MNSLSLSLAANLGGENSSSVSGGKGLLGADLRRAPFNGITRVWLKHPGQSTARSGHRFCVTAKVRRGRRFEYPWPKPEEIDPNVPAVSYLNTFKPLKEKPKPVILEFEKPLVELQKNINDVRKMAEDTGLDFTVQINELEKKYQQAFKDLHKKLTPYQRLTIARHPNRPTFLDHVLNMTDMWVELHGDRAGYDDPAIVTGLGMINGKTYMFIGHQKGRNTKENIQRNFAMPTPHGYRKALRLMRYADHHGFPIVTMIDTPGAFADLKCEHLGQGESIAFNLRAMFGFKVPIITFVIGEGGSGGALAIGCGNKLYMLENAVYYVASPEACAAILWKSAKAAPMAAARMKITAQELCKLKVADGIVPEPLGGAHNDPAWTSQQMKERILKTMEELGAMDEESLLRQRQQKFRGIGGYNLPSNRRPVRVKRRRKTIVTEATADVAKEMENIKKAAESKGKSPAPTESTEKTENK